MTKILRPGRRRKKEEGVLQDSVRKQPQRQKKRIMKSVVKKWM